MDTITPRQLKTLSSLLAKANPPPLLHRYRRANEWTLNEITKHEVHVPRPQDMNDPFEYAAPLLFNLEKLQEIMYQRCLKQGMDESASRSEADAVDSAFVEKLRARIATIPKTCGTVCLSATPRSNRMWAYYADCHRGVCIGYRTAVAPFSLAMSVIYEDPAQPMDALDAWQRDPSEFCDHIARRKGKEWEFEEEYRIPVGLFPENHKRILPVPPECIQEIRLGVRIEPDFKKKILDSLENLEHKPKVIQMGCDNDQFLLTEYECQPSN
jgi:hypothetical protein